MFNNINACQTYSLTGELIRLRKTCWLKESLRTENRSLLVSNPEILPK